MAFPKIAAYLRLWCTPARKSVRTRYLWKIQSIMNDLTPEERSDLITQYRRMALVAARPFRHPSIDRADVHQIAMLALVSAVDSYDPTKGAMSTHVWNRVTYALQDEFRRIKRHIRSAVPLHGRDVPEPKEDPSFDVHEELWGAIRQLPERPRRVLIHYFGLEGYKPMLRVELARKYGLSPGTITASNRQSVEQLRQALSA